MSVINSYSHKNDYYNYKNIYDQELLKEIEKGDFINGKTVKKLENNLSDYIGIKNSICVSSGTDALLLALLSIGIKEGDEIITTPFTWISTSEVIVFLKALPVFVDIKEETFNIDPDKIEEKITSKTKCILPVSLFGQICDMKKISEIAKRNNLYFIEDGAQSFGSENKNIKSLSYADISCTSFYPTKPLGCWGDGGACFTNNEDLAFKIRCLRNHGAIVRGEHKYIGLNARMDSIQASILNIKLKHYNISLKNRIEIAERYDNELKCIENIILPKKNCDIHVYAQYTIIVENKETRDNIISYFKENNIFLSVFYLKPIYKEECMKPFKNNICPVTEDICQRCLALTCYDGLEISKQNKIIELLYKFYKLSWVPVN